MLKTLNHKAKNINLLKKTKSCLLDHRGHAKLPQKISGLSKAEEDTSNML